MFKSIITLMAFLNFQLAMPQLLYAQESEKSSPENKNSIVEQDFKEGIKKLQNRVQLEDRKQQIDLEKKNLHEKKIEYKQGIQDDLVVLKARLSELNYLANFLDVDESARLLVARSISNASPKSYSGWNDVAAVSAIVMVPSAVVYGISKYVPYNKPPQVKAGPVEGASLSESEALGIKAKARAVFEATRQNSARMYNAFRGYIRDSRVRTTAGVVTLVSAVTTASALAANYYVSKPYKDAAESQSRVFLSKLVSSDQNNYLTYHQIDSLLTSRAKDESFGDSLSNELNQILTDTREKTKDIHIKQVSLMNIDHEINNLDQQLKMQKTEAEEK